MTRDQESAIIDAYLDLVGSFEHNYDVPHDWNGHLLTIRSMSIAFEKLLKKHHIETDYFDKLIQGTDRYLEVISDR